MKKLIVITLALILTSSLFAQDNILDAINKKSKHQLNLNQITEVKQEDRLQYQVDYTRHCLEKYRHEKMTGIYLQLSGGLIVAIGNSRLLKPNNNGSFITYQEDLLKYEDNKMLFTIVGCGLGLAGTVFTIINSRWLKRAYIGPNGMGVKFKF